MPVPRKGDLRTLEVPDRSGSAPWNLRGLIRRREPSEGLGQPSKPRALAYRGIVAPALMNGSRLSDCATRVARRQLPHRRKIAHRDPRTKAGLVGHIVVPCSNFAIKAARSF